MPFARLVGYPRPRIGRQNVHGHFVVPHYIQPVPKVLPGARRNLQKHQFINRSLVCQVNLAKTLLAISHLFNLERHIGVRRLQPDGGLVGKGRESDNQPVALTPDGRCRKNFGFHPVSQFELARQRLVLLHPENRRRRCGIKTFLSAALVDQASGNSVGSDDESKLGVFNHNPCCVCLCVRVTVGHRSSISAGSLRQPGIGRCRNPGHDSLL